jgi:hypothetical protein
LSFFRREGEEGAMSDHDDVMINEELLRNSSRWPPERIIQACSGLRGHGSTRRCPCVKLLIAFLPELTEASKLLEPPLLTHKTVCLRILANMSSNKDYRSRFPLLFAKRETARGRVN